MNYKNSEDDFLKKRISFFLALILMVTIIPLNAFAAQKTDANKEIIFFDDGSYFTVEVSGSDSRATSTKSGDKTYTYHASDGTAQWKAVLSGSFTYDGSSSKCTSSGCSVTIYKSDWYTITKTSGRSGNTATAEVTMGRKVTGVSIDKKSISISLSCDANGKLS